MDAQTTDYAQAIIVGWCITTSHVENLHCAGDVTDFGTGIKSDFKIGHLDQMEGFYWSCHSL